jgi:hypothetical protein
VISPAADPKTRSRDLVGTDGCQVRVAEVSWAKTLHINPKPLDKPTAKLRLEARYKLAECLKTGTEHLSPLAVLRIIQVARKGIRGLLITVSQLDKRGARDLRSPTRWGPD